MNNDQRAAASTSSGQRKPVALGFLDGGVEVVVCDDGAVFALHYGENGPDKWDEYPPIPGSAREAEQSKVTI